PGGRPRGVHLGVSGPCALIRTTAWIPDCQLGTGSFERIPELAQRPVDASLDGRQRLARHAGDLRDRKVCAEAQRDRLALLFAEDGEASLDEIAVGDLLDLAARAVTGDDRHALDRSGLA